MNIVLYKWLNKPNLLICINNISGRNVLLPSRSMYKPREGSRKVQKIINENTYICQSWGPFGHTLSISKWPWLVFRYFIIAWKHYIHSAHLTSSSHWWVCRFQRKRSFFKKVEKGFPSFLTFPFSMPIHASMFEYAPSPLGCSLRICEAWGLVIDYLNCYLSPKILFKQEFGFLFFSISATSEHQFNATLNHAI